MADGLVVQAAVKRAALHQLHDDEQLVHVAAHELHDVRVAKQRELQELFAEFDPDLIVPALVWQDLLHRDGVVVPGPHVDDTKSALAEQCSAPLRPQHRSGHVLRRRPARLVRPAAAAACDGWSSASAGSTHRGRPDAGGRVASHRRLRSRRLHARLPLPVSFVFGRRRRRRALRLLLRCLLARRRLLRLLARLLRRLRLLRRGLLIGKALRLLLSCPLARRHLLRLLARLRLGCRLRLLLLRRLARRRSLHCRRLPRRLLTPRRLLLRNLQARLFRNMQARQQRRCYELLTLRSLPRDTKGHDSLGSSDSRKLLRVGWGTRPTGLD